MYELVLLHPHHFLQKGSALTVFTEDGDNLSGKMYVVSPDGALREGREASRLHELQSACVGRHTQPIPCRDQR